MFFDLIFALSVLICAYLRPSVDNFLIVMLEQIKTLVEIESPSGDVAGSQRVTDAWIEMAQGVGLPYVVEQIPAPNYGRHLRAHFFGNPAPLDGTILLLGHTDTVHPIGSLAARPWRVEGERVYGPGIFDMKANCVIALEALRRLAAQGVPPRREVVILFTCDEETGSADGRQYVEAEARRAHMCLVLEPSAPGGKAKTGRKGTGLFHLQAQGVPAHAGLEPEKGANAILELARHFPTVQALNEPASGTTVNVCTINGGTASNVIPEHAAAEIDVRFTTLHEAERVNREIRSLAAFDPRVTLSVGGGLNRPPLERTDAVIKLFQQAQSVAAAMNYELGETQVGGGSDGNFVGALGVPVLDGLGVQGDGAHTNYEHIIASDLPLRVELLARLLRIL